LEINSGFHFEDSFGPDPVLQYEHFCKHLTEQFHYYPRLLQKPICELLYDQKLFNGIGNYLRSEILHRVNIQPFTPAEEIFKNKNLWHKLLRACKSVPGTVIKQISSNFQWYNDQQHQKWMKTFLKVYGNPSAKVAKDSTKKKVWYTGPPGSLYSRTKHQVKNRRYEKVGPWSGWDERLRTKFLVINIPNEILFLSHRKLPHAHRPATVKTGKRGRPMINRPNKASKCIRQYDNRSVF